MFKGYRINAITPAGRKMYMEVLTPYVFSNRHLIDKWTLWVNTHRERDISYCKELKDLDPNFVNLVFHDAPIDKIQPQSPFFINSIDPEVIYIKFDDDICFIEPGAIEKLLEYRVAHPEPFLVLTNTICNGYCAYLHQKFGSQDFLIESKYERIPPEYSNKIWSEVYYAEYVHKTFLNDILSNNIQKYKFTEWELSHYQRFAINCMCWFGKDFLEFGGIVDHFDEEDWLTMKKPKELGRPNVICGESLVSHFAYHKHRKPFCPGREIDHRILKAYKILSGRFIDKNKCACLGVNDNRDLSSESIGKVLNAKATL